MSVNEVLEAVRTMSPEERARVRALIEALPAEPRSPEEQAQQNLYEAGLLVETEPRRVPARARHTPVPIKGKPLSETVIEERG
jgi:hypothetical protein